MGLARILWRVFSVLFVVTVTGIGIRTTIHHYVNEHSKSYRCTSTPDPKCEALEAWLIKNGGLVYGLRCALTHRGRGLVATSKSVTGQRQLEVPKTLWFSAANVRNQSKIGHILDTDEIVVSLGGVHRWGQSGFPLRLSLAMVYEKHNPKSFWKPYLDTLSENFTIPLLWDKTKVAHLQSPSILKESEGLHKHLNDTLHLLSTHLFKKYPKLFKKSKFRPKWLKWAISHLYSRAFTVADSTYPRLSDWGVLIPFGDLMNHRKTTTGEVRQTYSEKEDHFEFNASMCYTAGAEVEISYGAEKSSALFYSNYGFLASDYNTQDYVTFKLSDEARRGIKAALAHNCRHGFVSFDGRFSEAFLGMFTSYLYNSTTDREHHRANVDVVYWEKAFDLLLRKTRVAINAFTTTLAYDLKLMETACLDPTSVDCSILKLRTKSKIILVKTEQNLVHRSKGDIKSPKGWRWPAQTWLWTAKQEPRSCTKLFQLVSNSLFTIDLL
eukprot:m.204474 g.204474  ORF g.204474 m.204474 type:complete len:495 (+) comp32888_c6_seq1:275-1759(+)